MSGDLNARLDAILRRSRPLMQVLGVLRDINLPDWQVFFRCRLPAGVQPPDRA